MPIFLATGVFWRELAGVSWWGSKSGIAETAPVETPIDPVEHAQARVREVKSKLDLLDAEMRVFKTTNHIQTDRFGRLLGCQCAELSGKPKIEALWRALLTRRDRLVAEWHAALHAWASVKEKTK